MAHSIKIGDDPAALATQPGGASANTNGTMNTPDTEWEARFDKQYTSQLDFGQIWKFGMEVTPSMIKSFLRQELTSRDTYWKERVENVLYDVEEHASQQDSDEEIGGMLRAVEIIRNHLDINANR